MKNAIMQSTKLSTKTIYNTNDYIFFKKFQFENVSGF